MAHTYPYNRQDFYSEDMWQLCNAMQQTAALVGTQLSFIVSGSTYTNAALVGQNLINLFYAGQLLIPGTDYTFDNTPGTITFVIGTTNGIVCVAQYN